MGLKSISTLIGLGILLGITAGALAPPQPLHEVKFKTFTITCQDLDVRQYVNVKRNVNVEEELCR